MSQLDSLQNMDSANENQNHSHDDITLRWRAREKKLHGEKCLDLETGSAGADTD